MFKLVKLGRPQAVLNFARGKPPSIPLHDALVIATGGLADYILAETNIADVHDPTLTLKGLRLYYERNVTCPKG